MVDPRDKIIEENMGTIKGVVMNFADGSDQDRWDDLYLAAMFGAHKALETWDESKGAGIKGHLRTCCRAAVMDELRKIYRWGKETPFSKMEVSSADETEDVISYDDSIEDYLPDPEETLLRKEEIELAKAKVAGIVSTLNEREQYVLFNHILEEEPETLRGIASQFDCSPMAIVRDKQRLLKLLREGEELTWT